ncbi:MAG: SLC13 family permease [Clostridiales bacterium]|nr:SLC13 family permease [Clostridiales bacterium]
MKSRKRVIHLVIGPLLFALCCACLPHSVFTEFETRAAVGTIIWMAYWWVTGPVDYAVTAFLPIALNAIFQMTDMSSVISNYADETILLLLGASIISVMWENTGLDKRIAVTFLRLIGSSLRTQLVFWFMLAAVLSAVLPNAVVCATITPIAVAMLKYIGMDDIKNNKTASKILLTIAYATGLGGLASPLGGAMNLVTVDYIQKLTDKEYMYSSWIVRFLPIMVILCVINIVFTLRDVDKNEMLGGSREYFVAQYKELSPFSYEEKTALILFVVATVLAFTRQLYQSYLPGLKPAYVFIICAIISFILTNKKDERIMVWKSVQGKIIWELMYIFAGGLAAGTLINKSGAAEVIGDYISRFDMKGGFVTILVILTATLIMSDVTSNTATAAVAMPLVISITQGSGLDPIPYIYVASIGVNLSYMLPTSIRAIPVGYGLSPKYMFKEGWKISLIIIALMSIVCALLLKYWPAFSTV